MEFNYTSTNVNVSSILYSAQLIADAFSKTLEDNHCLLILPVGLHQEIVGTIKDTEDLSETISDTNNNLDPNKETSSPSNQILNNLGSSIREETERCALCKLTAPAIDFKMDLKALINKLKAQIDIYKNLFKINKFDFCQASYALQSSCLPDILKLITLLLTAYLSIMALRKLSSISVGAFIKGVLSTLLSKLMSTLKISVNIGSTNVACLINALREIALAIPTQDNIQARLNQDEKLALGLIDANNTKTDSNILKSKMLDDLNKSLNDNANLLRDSENYLENTEKQLNETFNMISTVVDGAVEEVGSYVASLLSFQTYFECETTRSGMDVLEVINSINNLIQVINLLSAVALSIAKKNAREAACKTKDSINRLSENQISDLQIKDIIEDYNQKMTELIHSDDNGIEVLIHETPKQDALPKISLLDCSIDDFIDSHTLPNIIDVAKKQVNTENNKFVPTDNSKTYVFKKPSTGERENIENIVNIIYDPPTKSVVEEESKVIVDIKNPIGKGNISDILTDVLNKNPSQNDLKCKSIDDVLSVLESLKR